MAAKVDLRAAANVIWHVTSPISWLGRVTPKKKARNR